MAHVRQSRPDSGLILSHFAGESLYNLLRCSLFARNRPCGRCTEMLSVDSLNPRPYRGTSLIRNRPPVRTLQEAWAQGPLVVLGGGGFSFQLLGPKLGTVLVHFARRERERERKKNGSSET